MEAVVAYARWSESIGCGCDAVEAVEASATEETVWPQRKITVVLEAAAEMVPADLMRCSGSGGSVRNGRDSVATEEMVVVLEAAAEMVAADQWRLLRSSLQRRWQQLQW